MYGAYTVEEIRAAEEATGPLLLEGTLMQRAAAGLASVVIEELSRRRGGCYAARVLLVVGSGNNGGDGLYAGARLARRGVRVTAWRAGSGVHEAGWAAFRAAGGVEVDAVRALECLAGQDLVVDAVLGIGGRGGLRPELALFAEACRDTGTPVVAVDLPSGLEADRSGVPESFEAAVTVTFGAPKYCHVLQPARSRCGTIHVIDIGLALPPARLRCWEPVDLARALPIPDATSDKYSRGVVGVDAGSATYPGAGVLACTGATYAGAGMVRYTGDDRVADLIRLRLPNVVCGDGRVQARLLGSGWGDRPDGRERILAALTEEIPLVIDADGLQHLPGPLRPDVLLTPHAGELARMLGIDRPEVTADPMAAVRMAARTTGATVLLKGATQYVTRHRDEHQHHHYGNQVTLALPGPGWTAQAGSGDVLAGVCATFLAAGLPAVEAALAAASLQALTARRRPGPIPPQELAKEFPTTFLAISVDN